MGRYSLVVVNKFNNSKQIINVYDLEKKDYKEKVHMKDIDAFTSSFESSFDFVKYLNEKEIIDFSDATFHIVTRYNGTEYYFKTIFNSDMINEISKTVKAGYLDSTNGGYKNILSYFYGHVKEKSFQESIQNSRTINQSVKNLMLRYIDFLNQENTREDELEAGYLLKWKIEEELKRYKTFRGFYIFIEQYKKYGFISKKNQEYQRKQEEIFYEQEVQTNTKNTIKLQMVNSDNDELKPKVISNVDDYNKEYDEFLSEEEYENAYGKNEEEYAFIKGVKHDKYTK